MDVSAPPNFLRDTPAKIVYHGYFWVYIFFILSGFVLPLRYFQTRRASCIKGGTFRRYFRLMIPVIMIFTLYYLPMKMDWFGPKTFGKIRYKNIGNLIFDGLAGTWFGDDTWTIATWTLSIELFATYLIYVAAQSAVQYRGRFMIYFFILVVFWTFQFLGFIDMVDTQGTD